MQASTLIHLTDEVLHNDFSRLAQQEREIIAVVLLHIQEVDKRRLYSALGYSSLFDYMTRGLKYSEGSAQRRISAARLSVNVPKVIDLIEEGSLTLSQTSLIQMTLKDKEPEEKEKVIEKIKNKSSSESEKIIKQNHGELFKQKSCLKIEIDQELQDMIRELQNLSAYAQDQISELKLACRHEIERRKKVKFKLTQNEPQDATVKVSFKKDPSVKRDEMNSLSAKSITAPLKRKVAHRDQYRCVKCGSTRFLHFDHCFPKALRGQNTESNLRLLCSPCNQRVRMEAKLFGLD